MKSIDIFPWNENFNTGVPKIDEQHRKLVQLLNRLASHLAFHSSIPALNVIFDELADYAAYHFRTEEEIWHEYLSDDPLESVHKEVHHGFVETVLRLKAEGNNRSVDRAVEEVLAFLTRWLASHILENDRYMAMVILAIQSGMPLDAAKLHAKEKMSGSTKALIDIILSIYESLSSNTLQLMRELAEHKRHDTVLQRNQKLILSMLENSPIAVRIATSHGRKVIFANQRYARLINAPVGEVVGADPKEYYAYPQDYEDTLEQLEQGNSVTDKLVELSIPGAETVWALATYFKIEYENMPAVLGWFYDITEIRKTDAQLQLLTANMSDFISQLDIEGKFLYLTAACYSILGFTEEELLGHSCYEFIHPDDFGIIRMALKRILEYPSEIFTLSYRSRCKEGHFVWVESTIRANLNKEHKIDNLVASTRDITERKLAENVLKEKIEELERFNRAMVGREIQMITLKQEINELCSATGTPARYVVRAETPAPESEASKPGMAGGEETKT